MTHEQQPGESVKAYEAFQEYLNLGEKRSIRVVSRKLGKSATLVSRWSSRWQWQIRIESWNAHMDAVKLEAEEEKAREMAGEWAKRFNELRAEEWELAQQCITRAKDMLAFPISKRVVKQEGPNGEEITVIMPAKWTTADACRLLEMSSKLRRLACGQPTDVHGHSGPDGGPIETENHHEIEGEVSILEGLPDEHIDSILSRFYAPPTKKRAAKRN